MCILQLLYKHIRGNPPDARMTESYNQSEFRIKILIRNKVELSQFWAVLRRSTGRENLHICSTS